MLQSQIPLKDIAFMILKNKIKCEIELITQLNKNDSIKISPLGMNMAYDIMIEILNNILKKV